MAILKLALAITLVAIMAKKAKWAFLAMAICVINRAILGVQLKSKKKTSSVALDAYQSNLPFRHYINIFVTL